MCFCSHYRGMVKQCQNDVDEIVESVERFHTQVVAAGADAATATLLRLLYEGALARRRESDWRRLYEQLFAVLRRLSPPARSEMCWRARESLFHLLCDDLGARLFSSEVLLRLQSSVFGAVSQRSSA